MTALDAPRLVGVGLKMYLDHHRQAAWLRDVQEHVASHPAVQSGRVGVFVLPTFPSLTQARDILGPGPVEWGAQDIAAADSGPYTGEVSGAELAQVGCRFVEIGHAERRALFGEDDATVAAKNAAACRHALTPVICVGESERQDPDAAGEECVRQLRATVRDATEAGVLRPVVVAYEPVWAIGAPAPAPADHVVAVARRLRAEVAAGTVPAGSRLIYGGSAQPGILSKMSGAVDGLFLGRAAHDVTAVRTVIDEAAAQDG